MTNSLRSRGGLSTSWVALVDRALRHGLPGRCTFCLAPGCREPWCEACFEALPWNLPACPRCGEPQEGQLVARLCGHCLRSAPAFAGVTVPLRYEGQVAGLVQRFKFHASPRAGAVLLELLMAGVSRASREWPDALVPVPLHSSRARERGFDQAAWLARRLAGRIGCPWMRAKRLRDTPSQRGLTRSQRQGNLRRVFRVDSPLPPRVVLVDDVMTTGATLNALALACRESGAEEVMAWVLARTPRHDL